MGVRPYKAFTFDGESSLTYGVYLTGEGVFNAPERAVEMLDIPGRNGSFALDQGRFQNISVTYKAGMVDDSESDFATRLADFRSWICSKVGYCRLEDDYNTGEYRMAVYMSGLEVDHDDLQTGEFDITFSCKPQRFLTSGETAITVTSGDTITNPTRYASQPQLQVWGYGKVTIGNDDISVEHQELGNITIAKETSAIQSYLHAGDSYATSIQLDTSVLESGDAITAGGVKCLFAIDYPWNVNISNYEVSTTSNCSAYISSYSSNSFSALVELPQYVTHYTNTPGTYDVATSTVTFKVTKEDNSFQTITVNFSRKYTATNEISVEETLTESASWLTAYYIKVTSPAVQAYSTWLTTGHPLYIDLDVGEAWNEDGGYPVSLNNTVVIPAELPTLPSGATSITYDNTITQLKVVPRWWKV